MRRERPANLPRDSFFPGAPDLAIEVVSPNDLAQEGERNVQESLTAGAAMGRVLYPETRHVIVDRPSGEARILGEKDALEGANVLPGVACQVEELFGREPRAKSGSLRSHEKPREGNRQTGGRQERAGKPCRLSDVDDGRAA